MEDPTLVPIPPSPEPTSTVVTQHPSFQLPGNVLTDAPVAEQQLGVGSPQYLSLNDIEPVKDIGDPTELAKSILSKGEYTPDRAVQMVAFFLEHEKYHVAYDTIVWKNGEVSDRERKVPNPPPMFSSFARSIGVSEKTLKNWAKKHEDFNKAYQICEGIIKEFFVENGLSGLYPGQFAIFAAKNLTDMKDTKVNENRNTNMKDVLDALEKGTLSTDEI